MVAQSSTEAEFMGALDFGCLILFVRSVLWDIGVPQAAATILYEDKNACITMAMAQKPTPRMHHMDIKYHALVEWVERNLLKLEHIDTTLNLADHFTKQLGTVLFHRHADYILGKVPPTYSNVFATFSKSLPTMLAPPTTPTPPIGPVPLFRLIAVVAAHLRASWSYIINHLFV
jgi:hypothetical protein